MGLAFTDNGSLRLSLAADGSTSASLRAALHAALLASKWTASAIAGGYRYLGASPQGLAMFLDVWDDGDYSEWPTLRYVKLRVASAVSGGPAGNVMGLYYGNDEPAAGNVTPRTYDIWSDCCQLFISTPACWMQNRYDPDNPTTSPHQLYRLHAVQCGVPYVAKPAGGTPCAEALGPEQDEVAEAWWSCGSNQAGSLTEGGTFRNSLSLYELNGRYHNYSACLNGQMHTSTSLSNPLDWITLEFADKSSPRLVVPVPCHMWRSYAKPWLRTMPPAGERYQPSIPAGPERFMVWNPLIAWGPTAGGQLRLIGQLWDAVVISDWRGLDEQLAFNLSGGVEVDVRTFGYGVRSYDSFPALGLDRSDSNTQATYGGVLALVTRVSAPGGMRNYAY